MRLPRRGWTALLIAILVAPLCAAAGAAASAPANSPVGRWKTVDDRTGKVKSVVAIREQQGVLYGKIVQLFNPPVAHPLCIRCTGVEKDRPVLGMQILWGLRKHGNQWSGGWVLDPENGKTYRCTLTVENGGKVLLVRGYIGFSIFGRTERWLRVPPGQ